jgi:hypothetical protein
VWRNCAIMMLLARTWNLKGQCHEIFVLQFFWQTIPLGPLVHRLKPFRYGFAFAKIYD